MATVRMPKYATAYRGACAALGGAAAACRRRRRRRWARQRRPGRRRPRRRRASGCCCGGGHDVHQQVALGCCVIVDCKRNTWGQLGEQRAMQLVGVCALAVSAHASSAVPCNPPGQRAWVACPCLTVSQHCRGCPLAVQRCITWGQVTAALSMTGVGFQGVRRIC